MAQSTTIQNKDMSMYNTPLHLVFQAKKLCPAEFLNFFCHLSGQVLGKDISEVWGVAQCVGHVKYTCLVFGNMSIEFLVKFYPILK